MMDCRAAIVSFLRLLLINFDYSKVFVRKGGLFDEFFTTLEFFSYPEHKAAVVIIFFFLYILYPSYLLLLALQQLGGVVPIGFHRPLPSSDGSVQFLRHSVYTILCRDTIFKSRPHPCTMGRPLLYVGMSESMAVQRIRENIVYAL